MRPAGVALRRIEPGCDPMGTRDCRGYYRYSLGIGRLVNSECWRPASSGYAQGIGIRRTWLPAMSRSWPERLGGSDPHRDEGTLWIKHLDVIAGQTAWLEHDRT